MAKILVADDDVDVRTLIVLKLQSSGHEVTSVEDGEQAVARCRSERPDLVVLDLMMPGMSGLQACEAIRADADAEVARTPVILLTARAQAQDVDAGLSVGADEYLTKPFSPRELAARVDSLLSRDPA